MGDSTRHPGRSLCNQEWTTPQARYQESSLDSLCENLDISEGLGRILAARDLLNVEDARRFLNPAEDQLHLRQRPRGNRKARRGVGAERR